MTIIASCGHEVEHLSHLWNYSVGDYDRDGSRAVSYMSLCKECYDEHEKDGLILHDEGEENKWLRMDK